LLRQQQGGIYSFIRLEFREKVENILFSEVHLILRTPYWMKERTSCDEMMRLPHSPDLTHDSEFRIKAEDDEYL
jgi:hypothetical protein